MGEMGYKGIMFQPGVSYTEQDISGDGGKQCMCWRGSGMMDMNCCGGMGIGPIVGPYSGYGQVGLEWADLEEVLEEVV